MRIERKEVHLGTCIWFDRARSIGFIAPDKMGGPDIFVHFSRINDIPNKKFLVHGQRVSYIINQHKGRDVAAEVTKLDEPIIPWKMHPSTNTGNTPIFAGKGHGIERPPIVVTLPTLESKGESEGGSDDSE